MAGRKDLKHLAEEKLEEIKNVAKEKVEKAEMNREAVSKRELVEKQLAERLAAEAGKYIDSYTVTADDTLSHIALRFYGKATPPYYTLIYEANKDIIGENMNIIVPGQVLKIPVLPEDLK